MQFRAVHFGFKVQQTIPQQRDNEAAPRCCPGVCVCVCVCVCVYDAAGSTGPVAAETPTSTRVRDHTHMQLAEPPPDVYITKHGNAARNRPAHRVERLASWLTS